MTIVISVAFQLREIHGRRRAGRTEKVLERSWHSVKERKAEKDYSPREISRHYLGEFYQDSFQKILQLPGQ